MASTTSDLTLLGRKLGALDYNPDLYVQEIARRSVGGHDLLHQRNNIKVCLHFLMHVKRKLCTNMYICNY